MRTGYEASSGCYERGVTAEVFDRSRPYSARVLCAVATGGAIGASGRWLAAEVLASTSWRHDPGGWPWATLLVNIVGSFAIGFAARRLDRAGTAWAFVVTGVLGGFTTFSSFAVELNDIADAGRLGLAVFYAFTTIAAGVAATAVAGRGRP